MSTPYKSICILSVQLLLLVPVTLFAASGPEAVSHGSESEAAEKGQTSLGNSRLPSVNVGTHLQLFIDDALIESMSGTELALQQPTAAEVVLQFNAPWDNQTSTFVSVLRDNERYRMYYNCLRDAQETATCYAESLDGIHWVKPFLGLYPFEGSGRNNIIWKFPSSATKGFNPIRFHSRRGFRQTIKNNVPAAASGPSSLNFSPFLDANPNARKDERYKALDGSPPMALGSPDGIHWHLIQDGPVMNGEGYDSLNTAFWDPRIRMYVAYIRDTRDGVRSIVRRVSADFRHWATGRLIDLGGSPPEQLYTNGITPYFRAPDVFIGLPMRMVDDRKAVAGHPYPGVTDAVFMSSRDGIRFDRRFLEAFIRPGQDQENWTERSTMPAKGIVQTGSGEISIYYTEHYRHPTNRLRRATLRTDGFVSVHASYWGGSVVTKPLTFSGSRLYVNASTSAVGSVQVEILGADGRAMPGYSLGQSVPFYGDGIDRPIRWDRLNRDLRGLAGKQVRLRFTLHDADLYAFHFGF